MTTSLSQSLNHFIISRTDNIGDVILTLPMAGVIKEKYPNSKITFLGKSYTEPLITNCKHIDEFLNWDVLMGHSDDEKIHLINTLGADVFIHVFPNKKIARLIAKTNIPLRIGTSRRPFHLLTCNKKIWLKRKKSGLHEAQLNIKLLNAIGFQQQIPLYTIPNYYGLSVKHPKSDSISHLLDPERFNLLLHPCSKGSAREWGLANYSVLINSLEESKFKIFVTGTKEDGILLSGFFERHINQVVNLTGKMDLSELIYFISLSDCMLACSTGPLHIAASLGIHCIGLYAPMNPIFPERWAPLGIKAQYLVADKWCTKCKKLKRCECIEQISPERVKHQLEILL